MVEKAMLLGLVVLLVLGAASEMKSPLDAVAAKIKAARCDAQNVCVIVERDAQ